MPEAESRIVVNRDGDMVIVEFRDRNILDEANIQSIGEELSRIVDAMPNPKLLINFENVDHLSSAALGTLITINRQIGQKDGQLRLANIKKPIYEVFQITRLDTLFHIHDTTAQAVKSFG